MWIEPEVAMALSYLRGVERQGVLPSVDELDTFIESPPVKSRLGDLLAPMPSALAVHFKYVWKAAGLSVTRHLESLGWVAIEDGLVSLTNLGRAVQTAIRSEEDEIEGAAEVVLDPKDPLVVGRLIEQIGSYGSGLFVDPYFRFEQFEAVVRFTSIDRVLTSEKAGEGELSALAGAIAAIGKDPQPEIRVATDLHDRCMIADSGRVYFIGTSLNGVGRSFTVIGEYKTCALEVSQRYEQIWHEARVLAVNE